MPPTPTSSVSASDALTLPATLPVDAENSASDAATLPVTAKGISHDANLSANAKVKSSQPLPFSIRMLDAQKKKPKSLQMQKILHLMLLPSLQLQKGYLMMLTSLQLQKLNPPNHCPSQAE